MNAATQIYLQSNVLVDALEAVTPESTMEDASTDELDENICNGASPSSSDDDDALPKFRESVAPSIIVESCRTPKTTNYPPVGIHQGDAKWNLVKVRVSFDVTRKGERSLVIDGYKFTKSRDGMGDRVFWRCSRRECKATAVTVADRVEHIRAIHTHDPPVAAEFFTNTRIQHEQEVKFNKLSGGMQNGRRKSHPISASKGSDQRTFELDSNIPLRHSESDSKSTSSIFEQISPENTLPEGPLNNGSNGTAVSVLGRLTDVSTEAVPNDTRTIQFAPSTLMAKSMCSHKFTNHTVDAPPSTESGGSMDDAVSSEVLCPVSGASLVVNGQERLPTIYAIARQGTSPSDENHMTAEYTPGDQQFSGPPLDESQQNPPFCRATGDPINGYANDGRLGGFTSVYRCSLPSVASNSTASGTQLYQNCPRISACSSGNDLDVSLSTSPAINAPLYLSILVRTAGCPVRKKVRREVRALDHAVKVSLVLPTERFDSNESVISPLANGHHACLTACSKLPTINANYFTHWKKEKIRESVEEEPPIDQELNDVEYTDSKGLSSSCMSTAATANCEASTTCCCRYPRTTVINQQSNELWINSENNRHSPQRIPRGTVARTTPLPTDDYFLSTQIQNGILVKVLSTVQQLTAKLDGDADPPEVIQNCRAIQACLDTITALKRARSATQPEEIPVPKPDHADLSPESIVEKSVYQKSPSGQQHENRRALGTGHSQQGCSSMIH
ncbi:FLYWCH zinc finger domain protein, partial [Opisthorchis viverrini]